MHSVGGSTASGAPRREGASQQVRLSLSATGCLDAWRGRWAPSTRARADGRLLPPLGPRAHPLDLALTLGADDKEGGGSDAGRWRQRQGAGARHEEPERTLSAPAHGARRRCTRRAGGRDRRLGAPRSPGALHRILWWLGRRLWRRRRAAARGRCWRRGGAGARRRVGGGCGGGGDGRRRRRQPRACRIFPGRRAAARGWRACSRCFRSPGLLCRLLLLLMLLLPPSDAADAAAPPPSRREIQSRFIERFIPS